MIHKFTKTFHFVRQFLNQKISQFICQVILINILSFAHSSLNFAYFREKIKVERD